MTRSMISTELRVVGAAYLTPRMRRITFEGAGLRDFTSVAPDQQVKLFFAKGDQPLRVPPAPEDGDIARWYRDYLAVPDAERPWMRSYTVRRHLAERRQIEIDFVLHGADGGAGPASKWAAAAKPGDMTWMYGPASARPWGERRESWRLFVGDETALPAIGAFVESLAPGERALVYAEVADAAEEQRWRTAGDAEVCWVHRGGDPAGQGSALLEAVRRAELPAGDGQAWVAGEASLVRSVRRHLVNDRGMDRSAVAFTGYWRLHLTQDDDLTEEDAADRAEAMR
ncbi:siderophore-interacting protein [Streptomyces triticagri]|uniref:Siderophore-interacting protein n=1 Tax=Streptomyces triticagri TaxID=2293568 RepID=A0A372M0F1_9ACTN|nr:siderophore-interacting protein [Streptomyces triticagri]RFU84388.1 siderophore-interacting protein [Streptomyces triticagri]